jgi:flagellum-specific ATP synthase
MTMLADQIAMIEDSPLMELEGRVSEVRGLALRVTGISAPIGAMVRIHAGTKSAPAIDGEIVGFESERIIVMPFGSTAGVRRNDRVTVRQSGQMVRVGASLLGRVIDGLGMPIDGKGPLDDTFVRPLDPPPIDPMERLLIDQPLATGVRAIDSLISVGQGQRLGVFAAPGVGKSTLLAMMARGTSADVTVIALVGERGREVTDFLYNQLGDQGANVLLIMDSLTRFCQAQRQVGLAVGEPPATKGYTPSVFASLPVLLERSGRTGKGSITGFYAVLVEGDDMDDPIADAARGVLDGHVILSRKIAQQGCWPAIDVLGSISRVANDVTDASHQAAATQVRRLLAAYDKIEDLLNIGAYAAGSSVDFDLAIACKPVIDQLLQQGRGEQKGKADFDRTKKQLLALMQNIELHRRQFARPGKSAPQGPKAIGNPGAMSRPRATAAN